MADSFEKYNAGLDSPALHAVAVVAHDSTDFATDARSIYVGVTGDVTLLTSGGEVITFTAVPAGAILPIRTRRVNTTSTTASNMVALY